MTYRITLVIDESCGSQLDELVRTSYVWAIQEADRRSSDKPLRPRAWRSCGRSW
jgi:hypothetical protein